MTFLFDPHFQAIDANGNPYSGAKLYFYQSGTTTPITAYQDSAKGSSHTSPVVADSAGRFAAIFLDTSPYKYVLKTSGDVTLLTVDAIYIPAIAGSAILPPTNDSIALGSSSLSFSDLFLASGGVINWNNGDVTLTHSAGNLALAGSAADVVLDLSNAVAGQIKFPATQNATSDANTLDDYEEGTWTPTDASGVGLTFSTVNGHYTKIGRLVFATMQLTYPSTADTTNAAISLPVTSANLTGNVSISAALTGGGTPATRARVELNAGAVKLFSASGSAVTNANLSTAQVNITVLYLASS